MGGCLVRSPRQPRPGNTGRGTLAARPRGRAAGGETAPDTRRPYQRWRAIPPGRPPTTRVARSPPQGMQAKGTVLDPHARTPAPTARRLRTRTARPEDGQSGEGERLKPTGAQGTPPGTPSRRHPHGAQRRLARAHAVGPMLGPHTHTNCARKTRVAEPWLPSPKGRAAGGGTAPGTRPSSQQWKASPAGRASHQPRATQPLAGHASQRNSAGAPRPHTRAHST